VNPALLTLAPGLARDVQSERDERGIAIDRVGIRGLRYPILVSCRDEPAQPATATWELTVDLGAEQRGTHMSRFVEALTEWAVEPFDGERLVSMLADLRDRFDAGRAYAECAITLFLERRAPVSGLVARLGIDCRFAAASQQPTDELMLGVRVPVTTLCPCSKEISEYGAHNQRGYIDIGARVVASAPLWFEDLIDVAETAASAPVYPLLKRVDERHVTMQAYDAPAFVEDVVRATALRLSEDERILGFTVEAENHESIHDHAAVATVSWERP
jgi:GTP cyclohydrolase I